MTEFRPKSVGSAEERERISALVTPILDSLQLQNVRRVLLTIYPALAEPTNVMSIHSTWRPQVVHELDTPGALPRGEVTYVCPRGSRLVEIECVQKWSGGMSSQYGFDGYFLSLAVDPDLREVIDARGEQAY